MSPELATREAIYLFAAPLIVAVVEYAKRLGVPDRAAPVVALVLGLATAFAANSAIPEPAQHWLFVVLAGTALGLSAGGLYGAGKATLLGK